MALGEKAKSDIRVEQTVIDIPVYWIGPLSYNDKSIERVPLATLETALAPSTNRGMKAIRETGGCQVTSTDYGWSRAPLFVARTIEEAQAFVRYVKEHQANLKAIAEDTTRYGKLKAITTHQIGRDVHVRIEMMTGDAAGQNMVTKAARAIGTYLHDQRPDIEFLTVSGNMCVDKKGSAINALLGHGIEVHAGLLLPKGICETVLKAEPKDIARLVTKKDHVGSIAAGSTGYANAHYANLVAAMYLATGQDIANIVEGAQGITTAECATDGSLYFTVTLPSLVVGTVGNGKNRSPQKENLERIGCAGTGDPVGSNRKRLAEIVAATVLAGELSLHAALTTGSRHLVEAHEKFER